MVSLPLGKVCAACRLPKNLAKLKIEVKTESRLEGTALQGCEVENPLLEELKSFCEMPVDLRDSRRNPSYPSNCRRQL